MFRFLDAYKSNDISIWGLSVQNEPLNGESKNFGFNSLGYTSALMRDFIKSDLGPALMRAGYGSDKLKLIIMDSQLAEIKNYADTILGDSEAVKYVSGVAFHWYFKEDTSASILDKVHYKYPKHFIISIEACEGVFEEQIVSLGNWTRAETYADDILTVS
jgi:glucosylceramidase